MTTTIGQRLKPKPEHRTQRGQGTFFHNPRTGHWTGQIATIRDDGKRTRRTVSGKDEDTVWERFQKLRAEHKDKPAPTKRAYARQIRANAFPVPPPPEPGWEEQANCQGADTNLFFISSPDERTPVIARYCDPCPVKKQCLQEALSSDYQIWKSGIWGGTTINERLQMLREARDNKKGTI